MAGNCISCPFHGAKFDVRTGDIEDGPSFDKIATYPATVGSDGYVYVEFPDGDKSAEKIMPDYCSTSGSSEKRHFVIVGAGTASHAAVEELRTSGFTGKITVISRDEPGQLHHFDRTALSKFLNVGAEKLPLRSDEWWSDRDVKLMLGRTVTAIDAATKIVTTDDGSCVAYDACLCATSGPARSFRKDRAEGFAIEGADLGNIFVCRDPSDSAAIHSAVKGRPGARVVVVGSSFIGMEVAGFLAKHHKLSNASERTVESITVVGMETEPFERVLGTEMGAAMRKLHERHGVAFAMSDTVAAFHPTASCSTTVGSVSLKSGATLQADICVIGAGMIPAVDYLRDTAGVTLAPRGAGVVVDATLQAAPGLFACGDIARFPYAQATSSGESFVRIEHWNVAIAHGRVAARNMLSGAGMTAFDVVPFFWSSQLGHNIRYAGHAESCDEVVLQGNFATPQVTAFYCKDGKVSLALLLPLPQFCCSHAFGGIRVALDARMQHRSRLLCSVLRVAVVGRGRRLGVGAMGALWTA